jgi:F0F1-type ATP synthase delta subunit
LVIILVLVQVITFIGLALILRNILISSSYKETHRLQQLNEENAAKSKELAEKILDAENEYREKMAKCEDEIRGMKAEARKQMEELKEAIIAKGKAESEHMIAQAINTKKELRAEIESEMYEKSVAFSCKIFKKILSSREQKLVYDGLLETVFQELDQMEKDHLQSIDWGGGADSVVEVKTSHPIDSRQKEKLEGVLSSKLDRAIKVHETIDAGIISGIIIQLGSIVIDGSLSERFRKAAEELK